VLFIILPNVIYLATFTICRGEGGVKVVAKVCSTITTITTMLISCKRPLTIVEEIPTQKQNDSEKRAE